MRHSVSTRLRLLLSSALVGVVALANSHAFAQTLPDVANAGGATPTFAGNDLNIDLNDASRVIDYNSFNVGTDNAVNFTSADMASPFSVLNRVIMANPSSILGDITSQDNIAVWLVNPSGITFGDGASFSGGALVLSTADIGNADFLDGSSYTLTQGAIATANPSDSTIILASGSTIGAPNGFVAIAQDVRAGGSITAGMGNVALVAAADTVLDFTPGGPLTVSVTKGTTIGTAQVNILATGAISARSITIAGGSANPAVTNLLGIDAGATLAATAVDGRVTIASATDSAGGVTIAPGQTFASDIRIDGSLTANGLGGDIGISSARAVTTSGALTADDQVTIGGLGDIAINGPVMVTAAGGDIGIVSSGAGVTTTAMLTAADSITIVGQGDVSVAALTATAGAAMVRSNLSNAALSGAATGDTLTVEAREGTATLTGMIASGRDYFVGANAIVLGGSAASTQSAADTINFTAESGNVSLGGPATVTLTSNSNENVPGGVTTITALGDGDIALAGAVLNSMSAGGTSSGVFLDATGDDITVGTINADLVSAIDAATITSGTIDARAGVTLTATGAIDLTDVTASAAPATIRIASAGNLTADSVRAGSNADLRGNNVAITSVEGSIGRVNIASNPGTAAGVTLDRVTAGTDIAIDSANGAAIVTGTVAAGGNYAVTGGSVTLGNAGFADQRAANNVTLTATGAGGMVEGLGRLVLTSNSDLAGGGATYISTSNSAIVFGPSTSIVGSGDGQASGIVFNSGTADLTFGNLTGEVLINAGVPANIVSTGNILTRLGLSLSATGNLFFNNAETTGPSSSVTLMGGTLVANSLRSVAGVTASADTINLGTVIASRGFIDLDADTGDLVLANGQSFTGASITKTGATGTLTITSLFAGIPAGAASSDIDIESSTGAQIGNASSFAGNVNVTAALDVTGIGASSRANLLAAADGASPTLSGLDRDVRVAAGGQALLGSVTAGRNISVTAADIDFSTTNANSGDLVLFAQTGQLTLGEGLAGGVAVLIKAGATGDLRITDSLFAGQEAGSNGTVVLQSDTDVLLAQYDAGGGSGFVGSATGDVFVTAGGSVAGIVAAPLPAERGFGAIGAAGDLSVNSSDDIRAASLSAGGNLTINTGGSLTGNGPNSTGTAVPGGALLAQSPARVVTVSSGNAVGNKVQLDTIVAGAGVTINSPTIAVGTIRTAAGTVMLNDAGGSRADQSNFYVGSLESSGSLALTLSGTPDAAGSTSPNFAIVPGVGAVDLTASTESISVNAAQVTQIDQSLSGQATAIIGNAVSLVDANAGAALQLTATEGGLYLGSGTSGATATLDHQGNAGIAGNELRVVAALTSAGAANLLTATNARIATATATGGALTVRAAGMITSAAGVGPAGPIDPTYGRANLTTTGAGNDILADAGNFAQIGTLMAGGTVALRAAGLFADTLTAGEDVAVNSLGGATILSASAGDDIEIRTPASLALGSATTTGAGPDGRRADFSGATLAVVAAVPDGGNILASADGTATLGTIAAAGTAALASGGDLMATSVTAGEDAAFRIGGAATLTTVTASDDIDIVSTGLLSIGTATTLGGGRDDRRVVFGAALPDFGAETAARSNILARASGNVVAGTLNANASVALQSAGLLQANSIVAGEDIGLSSASTINVGSASARDDVVATSTGDLVLGGVTSTGLSAFDDRNPDFASAALGFSPDGLPRSNIVAASGARLFVTTASAADSLIASSAGLSFLTTLNAGEDIALRSDTGLFVGTATAGDDIEATAPLIEIGSAATSGTGTDDRRVALAGALPGFGGEELGRSNIVVAGGSNVNAGTLTAFDSVAVQAAGNIVVAAVIAGEDAALSGGALDIGSASARDDVDLVAGGAMTLGTVVSNPGMPGADDRRVAFTGSGPAFAAESLTRSNIVLDSGDAIALDSATARDSFAASSDAGITAGTVRANEDVAFGSAGTLDVTNVEAGDDLEVLSTGAVAIRQALTSATGADDRRIDLGGGTPAFGAETLARSNALIDAAGAVTLGTGLNATDPQIVIAATLGVRSGGTVTASNLLAGEDIAISSGGDIAIGTAAARDDIDIASAGGIAILTLARTTGSAPVADDRRLDVSLAAPAFGAETRIGSDIALLSTGADETITVQRAEAAGDGSLITTGAGSDIQVTDLLQAAGDATINSTRDARLNVVRSTSGDITASAARDLTGLAAPAGFGPGTGLRVADLTDRGDTRIDAATGDVRIGEARTSGAQLIVESGGSTTGLSVADVGAGPGTILDAVAGRVDASAGGRIAIDSVNAAVAIAATASQISVATASSGGTLDLVANDALSLDSGIATGATLTTSGGAPAAIALTDIDAAQDRLSDAFGAANLTTGAGGSIGVTTDLGAQLGTVTSGGTITVNAAALSLANGSAATTMSLTARQGGLYLGTGTAAGAATLIKTDSDGNGLTDLDRDELRIRGALTATGTVRIDSATAARINAATGASVTSNVTRDLTGLRTASPAPIASGLRIGTLNDSGASSVIATSGDIRIDTLTNSNADVTLTAGGSITGGALLNGQPSGLPAGPGANLTATTSSITITAGQRAALGSVTAATSIAVIAPQISVQNAVAGTTLTLTASDALSIDMASSAGSNLSTSGGTPALIDLTDVNAGQDTLTNAFGAASIAATGAGRSVTLTAGRGAQLGVVNATNGVTVDAAAISAATVTAGGALALTARAGGLYLGTGSTGAAATLIKADSDGNGLDLAQLDRDELRIRTLLTTGGAAQVDSATDARINEVVGASIASTVTRDLTGLRPASPSAIATGLRLGVLNDFGLSNVIASSGDVRIGAIARSTGITVEAGGSVTGLADGTGPAMGDDISAGPGARLTATAGAISATAGERVAIERATADGAITVDAARISAGDIRANSTLQLTADDALSVDFAVATGATLRTTGGDAQAIALTDAQADADKLSSNFFDAVFSASGPVSIGAGRGAQIGSVTTPGAVTIAASAVAVESLTIGGPLAVTSRDGGLYLGTAIVEGAATLVKLDTDQNGLTDLNRDELRIRDALAAMGAVRIDSTTDARINQATGGSISSTVTRDLTGLVPPGPSSTATGLRVASLTDSGATLIDAASGDVRIGAVVNSGGNVVIESGDVATASGGSVTGLSVADEGAGPGAMLSSTAGGITATAGRRAAIGTATATAAISVTAAQISTQTASAGGALTLAAVDALSLDNGSAAGTTLTTSGGAAAAIGLTDANAAQDKLTDGFGAANLSATAPGAAIDVRAGGAAQLGTVGAGGAITVDASALSAETVNAGAALALTARQGGLYLGTGATSGAATLIKSDSDGNGLSDLDRDELRIRGALTATGGARIDSATDARLNAATGASITSNVTRDLTGLRTASPASIAFGLRVGTLADNGVSSVTATTGDIRIGALANSGGNVAVSAGGSVTGLSTVNDLAAGWGAMFTATGGAIIATAGQRAAIGTASATGAIAITAAQISAQSATAGGALTLAASDALSLDAASAAGATLSTTSGAAQGIARTDAAAAQDRLSDAFGAANIAATGANRSVTVAAGQGAQLGTVGATGAASVTAAAISAGSVTSGGALTLTAGQGALYLGTGSAGTIATLTKNDSDGDGLAAAQAGRDELRIRGALTAGGNVGITSATDNRIAGATATDGVSSATGSITITSTAATTGLLGATAGASDAAYARGNVVAAGAGQDVTITSGGLTQLGTVTAGRGSTVTAGNTTRNGAIDISAIRATSGALALGARAVAPVTGTAADGDIIIGTGNAGSTATLTNRDRGGTAGSITVATSLNAGGNVAITSAANERLAGDDAARGVTSSGGSLTIDAVQSVTGVAGGAAGGFDARFGRANLSAAAGGQDVTVLSGALVQAGGVAAGRNISVAAGTEALGNGAIDVSSATATSGSLLLTARATGAPAGVANGNIRLGTGSAGTTATLANTDRGGTTGNVAVTTSLSAPGLVTVDAANEAAVGAVTSTANNVLIRSNQIAINGIVRSAPAIGEVRLVNRIDTGASTVNDTVIGQDGAATQFVLSDAEVDRLQAARVVIQTLQTPTQTQNVDIGTLSLAAETGSAQFDVLADRGGTTDPDRGPTIALNGLLNAAGSVARTVRIGGADVAMATIDGTQLASRIVATPTATAGGRIDLPAANVELRANRVVFGLAPFRDAVIGLTSQRIAADFVANANSALFDAGGGFAQSAPNIPNSSNSQIVLNANSLTVRYRDFALFQNTAARGLFAGVLLGPSASMSTLAPVRLTLISDGNVPGANAFGLFGEINGFVSRSTGLLPPAVISFGELNGTGIRINLSASRLNGCVIGAPDQGCLSTDLPVPTLRLFDERQILLLSSALDTPLDFDPLIGANNESLFVDFGGFQVPTDDPDCIPGKDVDCPPPEGSE